MVQWMMKKQVQVRQLLLLWSVALQDQLPAYAIEYACLQVPLISLRHLYPTTQTVRQYQLQLSEDVLKCKDLAVVAPCL